MSQLSSSSNKENKYKHSYKTKDFQTFKQTVNPDNSVRYEISVVQDQLQFLNEGWDLVSGVCNHLIVKRFEETKFQPRLPKSLTTKSNNHKLAKIEKLDRGFYESIVEKVESCVKPYLAQKEEYEACKRRIETLEQEIHQMEEEDIKKTSEEISKMEEELEKLKNENDSKEEEFNQLKVDETNCLNEKETLEKAIMEKCNKLKEFIQLMEYSDEGVKILRRVSKEIMNRYYTLENNQLEIDKNEIPGYNLLSLEDWITVFFELSDKKITRETFEKIMN